MLREKWLSVSMSDKIRALKRNDETGYMEKACQDLFEDVAAANMSRSVSWRQRLVTNRERNIGDKELFRTSFAKRRVDGKVPKFNDLEEEVLYVPLKKSFPLGHMVWKHGTVVYAANATRQSSGVKRIGGLEAFINELSVPTGCEIFLCIVPKPDMYDKLQVGVPEAVEMQVNPSVVVLEMPEDYGDGMFAY